MRIWIAIIIGKICAFASRFFGRGGGSSLPGALARHIEPHILKRLLDKANLTSIIITGSNGKTTTARMIAECLRHHGLRIIWNRSGANMISGIISAVIEKCSLLGELHADAAVFEVDEANLRYIMSDIKPLVVLVTNCFRDQLDRYGEVDTTLALIRMALEDVPAGSTLILNADDPLVAGLATASVCSAVFYGIEDPAAGSAPHENAPLESGRRTDTGVDSIEPNDISEYRPQDARSCTNCGAYYKYSSVTYGHLGKYLCPVCGLSRPVPDFGAFNIEMQGDHGATFTVGFNRGGEYDFIKVSLSLPGLYNVYNCLAAISCCLVLDVPRETIEKGIASTSSAFGRMESLKIGEKDILIALVKNPVGFNEVIKTIAVEGSEKTIVACLNDNFADGRDISWIWDVDIELLAKNPSLIESIIASGTRAEDLAIRLKYAAVDPEKIIVEADLGKALELGLQRLLPGETLYILPTYTAMLEMREHIRHKAHAREFWRA